MANLGRLLLGQFLIGYTLDSFFHFLTGFKCDYQFGGNINLLTGSRVPGAAGSPFFYLENPKITQLNTLGLEKRVNDGIEGKLDNFLRSSNKTEPTYSSRS